MANVTGSNDKTVNKVALCSAMFAGFAYVGYSMVRTAFGRRGKRESEGKFLCGTVYWMLILQSVISSKYFKSFCMFGSRCEVTLGY